MKPEEYKISSEKFKFSNNNDNLHDKKLDTKPVSYFKDAMYRFCRNKASIVAAIIITILVLFAIFVPFFTRYTVAYEDAYYAYMLPKNNLFDALHLPFWDGASKQEMNEQQYLMYQAMYQETGRNPIKNNKIKEVERNNDTYYVGRIDSYNKVGMVYLYVELASYQAIQAYQDKTGIQIIYPITDHAQRPKANAFTNDANIWYQTSGTNQLKVVLDKNGDFIPIYKSYTGNDLYTSKVRYEGENAYLYDYSRKMDSNYEIRVDYYEYYCYYHQEVVHDRIKKPSFLLGTTNSGQDLLTCLASGARFSFILAILVASINLFVGAIYGAIEGYYGGKIDLVMERISDILAAIPFMIVITLLKYHSDNIQILSGIKGSNKNILILFIAFFLTGWIGMASNTRMQFYRFKNQEYVLVSRTLGAKDGRIMFKHILPNAIGTLITSCVLVIPSVIFSETSLSYLGIINLNSGNLTSVGTLLATGQQYLFTYPHIILFPALFISLLMLSFNLFGNGLRDAFNPALRGTEE